MKMKRLGLKSDTPADYCNENGIIKKGKHTMKATLQLISSSNGVKRIHQGMILAIAVAMMATSAIGATIEAVDLGTAGDYAILASADAAPITTTSGTSIIGDLGISPAALSTIEGFDETLHSSEQYATSDLVTGKIFAADMGGQTAADLTAAVSDMQAAYTDAAGRSNPDSLDLSGGSLNGVRTAG